MQFLTISDIVTFHRGLIDQFGGLHGIRDKGLLESAIEHPKLLYGIAMERDIYVLAASYCYHLTLNHAFIDGNKRIGTLAMIMFLRINGKECNPSKPALYKLAMRVATSKADEQEIANFLRSYGEGAH